MILRLQDGGFINLGSFAFAKPGESGALSLWSPGNASDEADVVLIGNDAENALALFESIAVQFEELPSESITGAAEETTGSEVPGEKFPSDEVKG